MQLACIHLEQYDSTFPVFPSRLTTPADVYLFSALCMYLPNCLRPKNSATVVPTMAVTPATVRMPCPGEVIALRGPWGPKETK